MTKTNLQKFISKYSLNGEITAVKWNLSTKDNQINLSAITNDKSLIYDVIWKNVEGLSSDHELVS